MCPFRANESWNRRRESTCIAVPVKTGRAGDGEKGVGRETRRWTSRPSFHYRFWRRFFAVLVSLWYTRMFFREKLQGRLPFSIPFRFLQRLNSLDEKKKKKNWSSKASSFVQRYSNDYYESRANWLKRDRAVAPFSNFQSELDRMNTWFLKKKTYLEYLDRVRPMRQCLLRLIFERNCVEVKLTIDARPT